MKDVVIYWETIEKSWSCCRYRIWTVLRPSDHLLPFYKPVPLFFSAKSWAESGRLANSSLTQLASGVWCPHLHLGHCQCCWGVDPRGWGSTSWLGMFGKPAQPDFHAFPSSWWLQGVKLFKFFQPVEQKPCWFTLITWTLGRPPQEPLPAFRLQKFSVSL